jgi:hypothetical protein
MTHHIQGHPGAIEMVQAAQDAKALEVVLKTLPLCISLNSAFAHRWLSHDLLQRFLTNNSHKMG